MKKGYDGWMSWVKSQKNPNNHDVTSHHIQEADAGLDRPLYLRNKCLDKTLKSQKLLI